MYEYTSREYFVIFVPTAIFSILMYMLIFSHISHAGHFLHYLLHLVGAVLAAFLTSLAIVAYQKTRITRLIFSAAAFALLTTAQTSYLYIKRNEHEMVDMLSGNELFDELILVMTILFAIGVFYKSEKTRYA